MTVVAVAATASDGSAVSYSIAAVRVNGTADTDPLTAGDTADSDLSSDLLSQAVIWSTGSGPDDLAGAENTITVTVTARYLVM